MILREAQIQSVLVLFFFIFKKRKMSVKNWLTTQMEILLGFSDPTLVGHILRLEVHTIKLIVLTVKLLILVS